MDTIICRECGKTVGFSKKNRLGTFFECSCGAGSYFPERPRNLWRIKLHGEIMNFVCDKAFFEGDRILLANKTQDGSFGCGPYPGFDIIFAAHGYDFAKEVKNATI